MQYTPKTKPFAHQAEEFELSRDMKMRALWWEQGTGKTKPVIDTLAWLFLQGKIRGVLVMAPKGVAPNWAADELDKHLPDNVRERAKVLLWDTAKSNTRSFQQRMDELLRHDGLAIVCMSYDGIMTEVATGAKRKDGWPKLRRGRELAKELMTSRPTLMVLDESPRIKNPNTQRTKRVLSAGPYATYRRVLSGTPIANSPFDAYTQIQFLDPFFWQKYGCKGWPAFKTTFADWANFLRDPSKCPHKAELRPHCGCLTFPKLLNYKNLVGLHDVMQQWGSRLLKKDVLDLPPKLFDKRRFALSAKQQELYDKLRSEFMAILADGSMITAPLVVTQLVRLQQITSGYVVTDDGQMVQADVENPRVDLLMDVLEDTPHKAIVWAKFRQDFAQIGARLLREEIPFVEYHGDTSTTDREEARRRFQEDPEVKLFVANATCAGEGLTLHAAQTVIYYNTDYKLAPRLQSEDRAHRIGQTHPVLYLDLIAEGSVDEKIIQALRDKKDIADLIMGDPRGNWI